MQLACLRRFWFNFDLEAVLPADRRRRTPTHMSRRRHRDGQEVVCQGQEDAHQARQGCGTGAAECEGRRHRCREAEVPTIRRSVVETVSTRLSTARSFAVRIAALVLVGLALAGGPASATVVIAKDFAALCAESDLIFVGTVTGVASRWSDPSKQAIETLVTFGDLTWLRGAPQATVTLRFDGGTVDDVHEDVAGVPHFGEGERRVIFAHAGRFVSPIV